MPINNFDWFDRREQGLNDSYLIDRSGGYASESKLVRPRLHSLDAELNVGIEIYIHPRGTVDNILTIHGPGESFVLHLLADAFDFHVKNRPGGFDVGDGREESGQFVAGEEGLLEQGFARYAGEIGVGEDGAADLVVDSAFLEDRLPFDRVVWELRVDLPVEIVQQGGDGPGLEVDVVSFGRELVGVGKYAGFDGEGVAAEGVVLDELANDGPSLIAIHEILSP